MSSERKARAGDCMSSIAAAKGFRSHRTLYEDPANADLKALRPEPSELHPGDIVWVVERESKTEVAPTGMRTAFVVVRERTYLQLRLRYSRRLSYRLTTSLGVSTGETDATGLIRAEVPRDGSSASLVAWLADQELLPEDGGPALRAEVSLGCLAPIDTLRGVQCRLLNLGYETGPLAERPDSPCDAVTAVAIQDFQSAMGLAETGRPEDVRPALAEVHDG